MSSATAASCGNADGSATVSVSGGSPGYTFLWANGDTTATITNLAAGSYVVTVTDDNGCSVNTTVPISNFGAPSGAISITNVRCFGENNGAIDLTISGGVAPFSFIWSTGATTEDLTGLAAGSYEVTVTASNGCILTEVVTIQAPALLVTTTSTSPEIFGNDGSAQVTPTGGTAPYAYLWSNGEQTATISGITAGTYSVTVTDANGCTTQDSVTVVLTVSVPDALEDQLFRVGPSPFEYHFSLFPNKSITGKLSVHLMDIRGRMVFAQEMKTNGNDPIVIRPGAIPDGIYMLVIYAGKNKMVKKIVKDIR